MSGIHLVHEVLDAQLVDRRKRKIGRVDELLLALDESGALRVEHILIGGPVRAARIGRWMQLLASALRRLGGVRRSGVSRVAFDDVRCIADTIELDVDERELDSEHLERWLKDNVVRRIPGGRSPGDDEERK
jgi:hypothetical protein